MCGIAYLSMAQLLPHIDSPIQLSASQGDVISTQQIETPLSIPSNNGELYMTMTQSEQAVVCLLRAYSHFQLYDYHASLAPYQMRKEVCDLYIKTHISMNQAQRDNTSTVNKQFMETYMNERILNVFTRRQRFLQRLLSDYKNEETNYYTLNQDMDEVEDLEGQPDVLHAFDAVKIWD